MSLRAVNEASKVVYIVVMYHVTWGFYYCFQQFGFHPFTGMVLASLLIHDFTYWAVGGWMMWLDVTHTPSWLYAYKIQKNQTVDWSLYAQCIKTVLFLQHVVNLPFFILMYPFYMHAGLLTSGPMPSLFEMIRGGVVCVIVEEILFYYSHRLFHYGKLYKYIHKQHHDFQAPVAIAAEYAHPIESIVSNTIPVLCGPLAAAYIFPGTHVALLWFWMFIALLSTLNSHSGYDFPISPTGDSKQHDFHHSSFRDNYGTIGFLDWLHSTNLNYKKHLAQLDEKDTQQLTSNVNNKENTEKEKKKQ